MVQAGRPPALEEYVEIFLGRGQALLHLARNVHHPTQIRFLPRRIVAFVLWLAILCKHVFKRSDEYMQQSRNRSVRSLVFVHTAAAFELEVPALSDKVSAGEFGVRLFC